MTLSRRRQVKARLVSDPFRMLADRKYARAAPAGLARGGARRSWSRYMTGFRMSFRTELIRRAPFDEDLGRYALFEDVDASLRMLDSHCLVGGAPRAGSTTTRSPAAATPSGRSG